ncbi:hypothetical protein JMJ55_25430 [Belnapia sp. T6]|uniref:Uncharacterized protein n=1 Tax=Belnapia mucosa TaxID=2804532 RepID=A0ABS1VAJ6_9PROT|nr:hypothetical protein [Belnapia mucosa]MBL6458683.1 hypothetical protein [Belnapia mucosa]
MLSTNAEAVKAAKLWWDLSLVPTVTVLDLLEPAAARRDQQPSHMALAIFKQAHPSDVASAR